MRRIALIGAALAVMALAVWSLASDETEGTNMTEPAEAEKQLVTPRDDLTELKGIIDIPGTPQVSWARLPRGRIDQTGRLPAPTDLILFALLDYGSADSALKALLNTDGTADTLDFDKEPVRYNWFPQKILASMDAGSIPVIDHGWQENFGGADLASFPGAPGVLLLSYPMP
jgi:hypothetical protein